VRKGVTREPVNRCMQQESCKTSHDPKFAVQFWSRDLSHFAAEANENAVLAIRLPCTSTSMLQRTVRQQQRAVKVLLMSSSRRYPATDTSPIYPKASMCSWVGRLGQQESELWVR
jgi:hypothetical protein